MREKSCQFEGKIRLAHRCGKDLRETDPGAKMCADKAVRGTECCMFSQRFLGAWTPLKKSVCAEIPKHTDGVYMAQYLAHIHCCD